MAHQQSKLVTTLLLVYAGSLSRSFSPQQALYVKSIYLRSKYEVIFSKSTCTNAKHVNGKGKTKNKNYPVYRKVNVFKTVKERISNVSSQRKKSLSMPPPSDIQQALSLTVSGYGDFRLLRGSNSCRYKNSLNLIVVIILRRRKKNPFSKIDVQRWSLTQGPKPYDINMFYNEDKLKPAASNSGQKESDHSSAMMHQWLSLTNCMCPYFDCYIVPSNKMKIWMVTCIQHILEIIYNINVASR